MALTTRAKRCVPEERSCSCVGAKSGFAAVSVEGVGGVGVLPEWETEVTSGDVPREDGSWDSKVLLLFICP